MSTPLRLASLVLVGVTLAEILASIMSMGVGIVSQPRLFPVGIVRLAPAGRAGGSGVPASQSPTASDVSSSLVTLPGVRP